MLADPTSKSQVGGYRVQHVAALDGVRGLAILLVMAYHETLLSDRTATTVLDVWFARSLQVGWCGVDLFFVLSGFLITGILLDSKGSPHYFRNFYARRTLRIFPLYYAVVFVSLVVIPSLPAGMVPGGKLTNFGRIEGDELWYWLYLSNFSIAAAGEWRHGILDISWSLAIEEQFYLVWPMVVLVCSPRRLLLACGGIVLISPLLRLALAANGVDPIAIYVLTPGRLDPLAVGAAIAVLSRRPAGLEVLARPAARISAIACAALTGLWLWRRGLSPEDPIVQVVGFSLLACLFGGLLVATLLAPARARLVRFFAHPFMSTFGKYSYALYLFHLPLRALVRDTVYGRPQFLSIADSQVPGQLIFYVLSTGVALLVAKASWELYERQFLKLKRHFPSGSAGVVTGSVGRRSSAGGS